jgi:hypothetical protein
MRFVSSLSLAGLLLLAGAPVMAQAPGIRALPETPAASPAASVHQRVGLTDVSIEYSSPAVNDRTVWGELVPYGEIWRAGANAATRLTVSTDFMFGETAVPAGTYTLVIMPEDGALTFILNTDSSGRGAYGYNEAENVASFRAEASEGVMRERFTYLFTNTTDGGVHLTLEWAGWAASAPITIDTAALVAAGVEATLSQAWRPFYNAARYNLESEGDLDQAATWMAQSIAINSNWWNQWFMAEIAAAQGNYDVAREHAALAMELGAGDSTWENFFLADAETTVAGWPN